MATSKELAKNYAEQLKKSPTINKANSIVDEINNITFSTTGKEIDASTKLEIINNIQESIINSKDYRVLKESDNAEYIKLINHMYDLLDQKNK